MNIGTTSAKGKKIYDIASMPRREALLEEIRKFEPFNSVLDIGCGRGEDLALIRELYPDVATRGIESNGDLVAEGNKNSPGTILEFDATILQYDKIFPACSYDVVITNATLMYFEWPTALLKEMYRIARKGIIMIEQTSYELERALSEYTVTKQPATFSNNYDWKTEGYIFTIRK